MSWGTAPTGWIRRGEVAAPSVSARYAIDLAYLLRLESATAARFVRLGRRSFEAAAPSSPKPVEPAKQPVAAPAPSANPESPAKKFRRFLGI